MNHILPSQIVSQLQRRQGLMERQQNQQAHIYSQTGEVLIIQTGPRSESVVEVDFTHVFTEKPNFGFGMAMDDNQQITPGKVPTVSAVVFNWITEKKGPVTIYNGAHLAIVTTGEALQRMYVNYRFEGRGLSFPTAASPSNTTGNA